MQKQWQIYVRNRGLPFLTDCNTLYPGSRKNALEHLDCANLNGFNTISTGCQILIGDGLRGTDEIEVPVVNGEYCKTAKIGRAIMDADIFISLTHFKGHEATGFGGTVKNIGMGCGSRAGKMEQHKSGKPAIDENLCRGCKRCAKECGSDAISYPNKKPLLIMINAKAVAVVSEPAALTQSTIRMTALTSFWTARWQNMHKLSVTTVLASISLWFRTSALTVTVTVKMTRRSCRISECSQALTRSRWIRPVLMPA